MPISTVLRVQLALYILSGFMLTTLLIDEIRTSTSALWWYESRA